MHKLIHKVAPLGVMTVCIIWCCWSQLRESTPLFAATEANLPRIERKLLNPELSPVSERDPFLQKKPPPPPATERIEVARKIKEEPQFDPRTVLPSIRLDATMPGARPLAVINGIIHAVGENIVLDVAIDVKCQLQSVQSDGVVVVIEKQTFLIGYSNVSREVTKPAAAAKALPADAEGPSVELPEGIPTPDELEDAVADSLANQPPPAERHDDSNAQETDDATVDAAHEDCEFERDLLINNKFEELLNHHEE